MKLVRMNRDEISMGGDYTKIPVGVYKIQIKQTKLIKYSDSQAIEFKFDIYEGEYKDYYINKFKANEDFKGKYENKYGGKINVFLPSDKYEKSNQSFWASIYSIEDFNQGNDFDDTDEINVFVGNIAYVFIGLKKIGDKVATVPLWFVGKQTLENDKSIETMIKKNEEKIKSIQTDSLINNNKFPTTSRTNNSFPKNNNAQPKQEPQPIVAQTGYSVGDFFEDDDDDDFPY